MGKMHARMPRNFVLEERLERYGRAIEPDPAHWRGQWAEACFPSLGRTAGDARAAGSAEAARDARSGDAVSAGKKDDTCGARSAIGPRPSSALPAPVGRFRAVHLDLGCGKGSFLAACAHREPDALFIGMDAEPVCIAYAAQRICAAGLANAVAVPGSAGKLARFFAPGELAGITLNFPTPHPKAHYARERLTSVEHLLGYRDLLAPGGTVTLRTDSLPLWRFTLETLQIAGYRALWTSEDVRADHPELPGTEYEARTRGMGATVYGVCAAPAALSPEGAAQARARAQGLPRSLMAYLPEDADALDYVPLGMERAVENLRNRRAKEKARALPR